ncbi:cytochrome P450 [Gloeopeniophorella convolvens]|nr:cytochrome P450 [Gloeopeniophorella convolvens]
MDTLPSLVYPLALAGGLILLRRTQGGLGSEIVYVESAGQPIVIVNDVTLANEMLDKRGSLYSDRPSSPMATELAGFGDTLVLRPCDRECTQMRKHIHKTIGTRNELEKYAQLFEAHVRNFIKTLSRRPEDPDAAIRHLIVAVIILITYGYEVLESGDPFIRLVDIPMRNFSEIVRPGAFLVDAIPILKYIPAWFPGAGFKRYAAKMYEDNVNMAEVPFKWTKNAMSAGSALPSFVSLNMEGKTLSYEEEHVLKWAASSLFAVVTPIGAPHKASVDDVHRGYHIPKDSIVVANIWHMLRDPSVYSNPEQFSPERFLETDGRSAEQDPKVCAFGFGRRICPGRQFADTVLWLTIATTLSVFRVSKVMKDGVEVTPSAQFMGNVIRRPVDFECDIRPRSARAEELILQS